MARSAVILNQSLLDASQTDGTLLDFTADLVGSVDRISDASFFSKSSFCVPAINNLLRLVDEFVTMLDEIGIRCCDNNFAFHALRLEPARSQHHFNFLERHPTSQDYDGPIHGAGLGESSGLR
jgi:hypothetical protein